MDALVADRSIVKTSVTPFIARWSFLFNADIRFRATTNCYM